MAAGEAEMNEQGPISAMGTVDAATGAEDDVSYWVRNDCSPEVQERLRAMQWLVSAPDRSTYLERQRDIAK